MNLYSELASDQKAQENLACRQIVTEISNFGITERQRLFIIYLLALEIENVEQMKSIVLTLKEVAKEIFLANLEEE